MAESETRLPTEMTDNGIQADLAMSMMGLPDMEEIPVDEEDAVTPLGELENPRSSILESLRSSIPSPEELSSLFSQEGKPLSKPVMFNDPASKAISSLSRITPQISLPGVTNLTVSTSVTNIMTSIESVTNSTSFWVGSTNVTILDTASPSWTAEEIGAVVIVSLMVPFILLSNIFVIICVFRFRRLHTPTNYFISSLAAVDIFVALVTPFGVVVEVFNFGGTIESSDVVLCLLPNRILMMACGVSVLTLANIAYDRHTALVSPLEYVNIMTSKKVAVMVSLTWIYSSFIVWLPLMAGWYDVPTKAVPCSANLIHGKAPLLFLGAIFVPSCIAIFVCYFRIFMVARHHAKAIATMNFAVHRHLQVKFLIKDTKYAKTLALVIGVFLVLWLPYLIFIFVKSVSSVEFNIWVQTYLTLLTVFNSGINPWIYAFKNNELKAAFKRMFKEFCRDKLCKNVHRRASLVSAVSSTPRLSRTDSRMASIVPEVTVDCVNEKLKRSLASLDGCDHDDNLYAYDNHVCLQSSLDEISPFSSQDSLKVPLRQAASCSNLGSVSCKETNSVIPAARSRSFSVDFGVLDELCVQAEVYESAVSCTDLYNYLDDLTRRSSFMISNNKHTVSPPSTRAFSPPSPHAVSPPSTPAVVETHNTNTSPSLFYIKPPPTSPSRRPSLSPSQASTMSSLNGNSELKHQPAAAPHIMTFPHHPQFDTTATSLQHHAHTQSPNCSKISLQSDVLSWKRSPSQENLHNSNIHQNVHILHALESFCDESQIREPHILSHTQSCPIFEPITAYQLLFPQIWEYDGGSPPNRKTIPYHLENCLDFVSLVHKETEHSHNGRHLV